MILQREENKGVEFTGNGNPALQESFPSVPRFSAVPSPGSQAALSLRALGILRDLCR
jgi:hypothetical protein